MPCCSPCFRSSLRQPKVPVTLEILQSITLSSAHLHARRKWKGQYKYLLAYVIKCTATQRQIFMKFWHIVSANHNLHHVCVDLRWTHIQRILYNYYNKSKLAIRDIMHLSGFFLFGYLFNTCMLLLKDLFIIKNVSDSLLNLKLSNSPMFKRKEKKSLVGLEQF